MNLSLRKRRTLIWKKIKYNWSVTKICRHFRISRYTFYYHWDNYQKYGWEGLEIKSKKPKVIHKIDEIITRRILELRTSQVQVT